MPPNAWLWSLIGNCATHNDIKLAFNKQTQARNRVVWFVSQPHPQHGKRKIKRIESVGSSFLSFRPYIFLVTKQCP